MRKVVSGKKDISIKSIIIYVFIVFLITTVSLVSYVIYNSSWISSVGGLNNKWLSLLFIIFLVLIIIIVYSKIINKYLKPAGSILNTTDKIAKGDLTKRADVVRNDEIGRVANSVNEMADTISMLVNNLEMNVKKRTLELEYANSALNEERQKLELILNTTAEGIYGMDREGKFNFCNQSFLDILGYTNQGDLMGKNVHYLIHHSYKDLTPMLLEECKIIQALNKGEGVEVEDEVFWRSDGTSLEVSYTSSPQYKDGELIGAVVTFSDITDRKQKESKIRYLTYHDSLTGLYNKSFFEVELERLDTERNLPISIIIGDVKGNEIPKLARIVTLAESYHYMTNELNNNSMSKEEAIEIIKEQSGVNYDPEIVKIFVEMMSEK